MVSGKIRKGHRRPRRHVDARRIYYAHAMCLYGSRDERSELCRIRRGFFKAAIVNPAEYNGHPEKLRDSLNFCLKLVAACDVVVFTRLRGKVTAGVGKEINYALKMGKPVFELRAGEFCPRTRPVQYITRAQTIRLYRVWRDRGSR